MTTLDRLNQIVDYHNLKDCKNLINSTKEVLEYLDSKKYKVNAVNYVDDESILIELFVENDYVVFEIFDNGDIVFLKRNLLTQKRIFKDIKIKHFKKTITI